MFCFYIITHQPTFSSNQRSTFQLRKKDKFQMFTVCLICHLFRENFTGNVFEHLDLAGKYTCAELQLQLSQ